MTVKSRGSSFVEDPTSRFGLTLLRVSAYRTPEVIRATRFSLEVSESSGDQPDVLSIEPVHQSDFVD